MLIKIMDILYSTFKTNNLLNYLFIAFAFFFPLSVFAGNLIALLIIFIWFLSKNLKQEILSLRNNKLFLPFLLFFSLHLLGLFWTSNIESGFEMTKKMLDFGLLFPIFLSIVKLDKRNIYIYTFLCSISIIVFLSFLIWLGLIEPFKNATEFNPTPLMTHITHGPFVAFSAYIIANLILCSEEKFLTPKNIFLTGMFLAFSVNIFITGGRAGQVVFLVLMILAYFQNFNISLGSIFKMIFTLSLFLLIIYNTSHIFKDRVFDAYRDIKEFNEYKNTSVGLRFQYAINSLKIIEKNPLIGVGTGDYKDEYEKINKAYTPSLPATTNPHNNYILILSQFGILGLISLLYMFFWQMKLVDKGSTLIKNIGQGLVLFFVVICFSDSYLLGHFTSFMFVFFSAFIYLPNKSSG